MNQVDFRELTKKREDWVRANKENGFDEGITNLLIELYPDNAHFIYELLQNAEDADATEVNFELTKSELRFSHNGKVFNTKDIEGITSIGQGTKADDINKIGKFGVGFKAVFAYTSTPKIYSGEYSFEINDLVIPIPIEPIDRLNKTVMLFPFNHKHRDKKKEKTTEEAFKEIVEGLEKIKDNTLLFLTNIKKLTFSIHNQEEYIERIENNEKIHIVNSKNKTTSYWLRFKKYLKDSKKLYVSIAYYLDKKQENIQPLNNGQVSIFFPAEKESSNLKFHIHAPFASTVARDSIKDSSENQELLNIIAGLICESLDYLKRNNLLNTKFLSCLPNENDNLSDFYTPIQNRLVDIFNEKKYLLSKDDTYRPANMCCTSSKKIKKLIGEELLPFFIFIDENGYTDIESELTDKYWLQDITRGSRAESFLNLLEIKIITEKIFIDSLLTIMDYISDEELTEKEIELENFILNKDDEWFSEIYAYSYQLRDKIFYSFDKLKKIIKLSNNKLNIRNEVCYFADGDFFDYAIVKKEVYENNEDAKRFLSETLGVKEIGNKEKIEVILDTNYKEEPFPEGDIHLGHIKSIVELCDGNKLDDIRFLDSSMVLLCTDNEKKKWWVKPSSITFDIPYEDTGLKVFSSFEEFYFLDDIYLQLDKQIKESFVELLKKLGSSTSICIKKYNTNERFNNENYKKLRKKSSYATESVHCVFIDYVLCQKNILNFSLLDTKASLLVWDKIRKLGKYYFKARYKAHARSYMVDTDSSLILQLKDSYMIPDKKGIFYKVQDMSQDMLPKEFVYDNRNGWLDAIGFGRNVFQDKEEYKEKEKLIKETTGGHDLEDIQALKNVSPDDFKKFIESQKMKDSLGKDKNDGNSQEFVPPKDLPSVLIDEDEHQKNIQKENNNNSNNFTQGNTNNKEQDKKEIIKIKDFLYKEYEGHCQVCGDTFADGNKNTSKIKSLNIGKHRDVNRKGNSLCLCFKHHEIFKRQLREYIFVEIMENENIDMSFMNNNFEKSDFVGKEDIFNDNDAFYMMNEKDSFTRDDIYFLPIRIFSRNEYIKFTKSHLMEFIEVWNSN